MNDKREKMKLVIMSQRLFILNGSPVKLSVKKKKEVYVKAHVWSKYSVVFDRQSYNDNVKSDIKWVQSSGYGMQAHRGHSIATLFVWLLCLQNMTKYFKKLLPNDWEENENRT